MNTRTILASPLFALIYLYKVTLSPFIGRQCRYEPTCSTYALTALKRHPLHRAILLSARRIGRCHPGAKGGYDPVPFPDDAPDNNTEASTHDGKTPSSTTT